jgi:uncharacterized protein
MLEVSLLISICGLAVIAVPIGISAFVPLRFGRITGRKNPRKANNQPSDDPQTLNHISRQSRSTFAKLRRTEGAASRLVEISEIVRESSDTLSIYLTVCVGKESKRDATDQESNRLAVEALPSFKPGQHIVFQRPATNSQPATRRCYSLSGVPGHPTWRITVKDATAASFKSKSGRSQTKTKDGSVSNWLHSHARVGDRFIVTGPQGRFTLELAGDTKPLLLLAAGVGITPIASMVHHELQFKRSRPKWMFYQVSDLDHAPLLTELVNRIEASNAIQGVIACSADKRLPQTFVPNHNKSLHIIGGKLNPRSILEAVQTIDVTVLMCGPMAWMESMKQGFIAEGVDAASVHYESFGGHAVEETSVKAKKVPSDINVNGNSNESEKIAFSIKFDTSQIETKFDGSQSDLLAHARANDVEIPSGCRMGNCGSCTVKLLKGTVDYKHPPASTLAADEILPCVCLPTSDLVVQA